MKKEFEYALRKYNAILNNDEIDSKTIAIMMQLVNNRLKRQFKKATNKLSASIGDDLLKSIEKSLEQIKIKHYEKLIEEQTDLNLEMKKVFSPLLKK